MNGEEIKETIPTQESSGSSGFGFGSLILAGGLFVAYQLFKIKNSLPSQPSGSYYDKFGTLINAAIDPYYRNDAGEHLKDNFEFYYDDMGRITKHGDEDYFWDAYGRHTKYPTGEISPVDPEPNYVPAQVLMPVQIDLFLGSGEARLLGPNIDYSFPPEMFIDNPGYFMTEINKRATTIGEPFPTIVYRDDIPTDMHISRREKMLARFASAGYPVILFSEVHMESLI